MIEKSSKNRNCPVCKSALRKIRMASTEVDFCPFCRGSWFDSTELQRVYAERFTASPLLLNPLPDLTRDAVKCQNCHRYGSRLDLHCKNCNEKLEFLCPVCEKNLEVSSKEGLSVDCCRNCKGVWLDGGELTKLFEIYSQQKSQPRSKPVSTGMAADVALDMLIWAPDLTVLATAQILSHVPDLASKGLEIAGDMPEIAGKAAEGLIHAAGATSDLAGTAISGAFDVAGHVAGGAADAAGSFIDAILDLISGIFD